MAFPDELREFVVKTWCPYALEVVALRVMGFQRGNQLIDGVVEGCGKIGCRGGNPNFCWIGRRILTALDLSP